MRAGANLSGADKGGFVELAIAKARRAEDENALRIWELAGADTSLDQDRSLHI